MAIDRRLIGEPDDFSALLDLYHRNYIRLSRLINLAECDEDRYLSWAENGLAVYLRITQRHAFTTELMMTKPITNSTSHSFIIAGPINMRSRFTCGVSLGGLSLSAKPFRLTSQ